MTLDTVDLQSMKAKRSCRLLIVAYAYPPSSSPGAVRVSRLVRRLVGMGVVPYVLTVGSAALVRSGGSSDHLGDVTGAVCRVDDPLAGFAGMYPGNAKGNASLKSWAKIILRAFLFPDRTILWALKLKGSLAWVKSVTPEVVLSSSPSLSAHIAAFYFSRKLKTKWIAEFRDPASWLPRDNPTSRIKRNLLTRLERHIVNHADATVVVSAAFADYFRKCYPTRPIYSVPNGAEFDVENLQANMNRRSKRNSDIKNRPLVLVHAGELYNGERNPAPLITAALRAQSLTTRPIRLRFLGSDSYLAGEIAQSLGAESIVEVVGSLSHQDALRETENADALVALLHDDPVGRVSIMSKLFDYIATANPILVVGNRDTPLSQIVEDEKVGKAFEYSDINGMVDWIESVASQPQSHDYDCISVCKRWSADRMAESMSKVIFSVL
jgi:glycosyltransferase involved in cell wall biosynthesis